MLIQIVCKCSDFLKEIEGNVSLLVDFSTGNRTL